MKKYFLWLLLFPLTILAQKNVDDITTVKNPKEGKLYFESKTKGLFLFDGAEFKTVLKGVGPVIIPPPPPPNPTKDDGGIKHSTVLSSDNIGFVKFDNDYKLYKVVFDDYNFRVYQSNGKGGFISRGKNFLLDSRVTIVNGFNAQSLYSDAKNVDRITGLGGLEPSFIHPIINETYKGTITQNPDPIPVPTGKFPVPVFLSYWLQDPDLWRENGNPNGYDPNLQSQGSISRLTQYKFRDKGLKPPFYATYIDPITISDGKNAGLSEYTYTYSQKEFDQVLDYVYNSGAAGIAFYFYDNDADVSEHIRLNQTTNYANADKVKFYYDLGSLGYNAKTTLDRISKEMNQARYYKIDGRPVVAWDDPGNSKFHVDRWIDKSGADYIVTPTESYWKQKEGYAGPVYISDYNGSPPVDNTVRASGNTSNKVFHAYLNQKYKNDYGISPYNIAQGGYFYDDNSTIVCDAVTSYCLPPTGNATDHSYAITISQNIEKLNKTKGNVIPNITTGFENWWWVGQSEAYTNAATPTELKTHLWQVSKWIGDNPFRVPFVRIYSLGETKEAGRGALLPTKNRDGTIDASLLEALKEVLK